MVCSFTQLSSHSQHLLINIHPSIHSFIQGHSFIHSLTMQNLNYIHNVELSQGEVSTILYYIESYFQGSDDNPEADADLMSVCRKLETLPHGATSA